MGKRFLDWLRPLPVWQKGCLSCIGCYGLVFLMGIMVLVADPWVDPEGHARRVEAQRQQDALAEKNRQEAPAREAAEQKRQEAERKKQEAREKQAAVKEAAAAKRRLEVTTFPEGATVTLFLNGSQVAQKTGSAEFNNLKSGAEYVVKVNADGFQTGKWTVTVPRSGGLRAALEPLPDLEVLSTAPESGDFGWYATGRVRNNTGRTYAYVQVQISLQDDAGNLVGSTMSNVNNLRPGQVWNFRALVTDDNATRWRVEDVSGL